MADKEFIYNTFDIVRVDFPYIEKPKLKQRPALILSPTDFNTSVNASIVAMITGASSSSWPFDTRIINYLECGLDKPSLIRFKLHMIDHRSIMKYLGRLSTIDQPMAMKSFQELFQALYPFNIPSLPSREYQL